MDGRILEIEKAGRFLRICRGFCLIEEKGQELGRVALDDLECVIFHSHDGLISQQLLSELATRGIPLVVCDSRHMPVGIYWSLYKHHLTTARLAAQASLSEPKRKRLWQQLVQAKIRHQALILKALERPCLDLIRLADSVRSGDPDNHEAQAAQRYWTRLFDENFRRDPDEEGLNHWLNYGYAVLRASVVRAVVGCGMHPALALHHHNAGDPTPLANDLMEPWRPLVDMAVIQLQYAGTEVFGSAQKAHLANVLNWDLHGPQGRSPLRLCIDRLCNSLNDICMGERTELNIAEMPSLEEIQADLPVFTGKFT